MKPPCRAGSRNTLGVASVILSPLSQRTRARLACFICTNCSGLNTEGLSYQNLHRTISNRNINRYNIRSGFSVATHSVIFQKRGDAGCHMATSKDQPAFRGALLCFTQQFDSFIADYAHVDNVLKWIETYLSPSRSRRNCSTRMQRKVGPTFAPGS